MYAVGRPLEESLKLMKTMKTNLRFVLILAACLIVSGCNLRGTPPPIYVTATPVAVLASDTPAPVETAVLGPTPGPTDPVSDLPTVPPGTETQIPTRPWTMTPTFTLTY